MSADLKSDGDALEVASARLPHAVVDHPHFTSARAALQEALLCSSMVVFLGSSRVGKTRLVSDLVADRHAGISDSSGCCRAIHVTAFTAQGRAFSWKSLWKSVLEQLDDPLPDRKVNRQAMVQALSEGRRPRYQYSTEDDLYRSVRDAARDRRLEVLFVDEASALVKAGHARTLRDQLDVLRNLADLGLFRVVLVSTPRLLANLDASSELLGRIDEVFVSRYVCEGRAGASEFRSFVRIVKSFISELPESSRFTPTAPQLRELHRGSLGAIGHLSRWFIRAITRCRSRGEDRLRWEHFEQTILSRKKLADLGAQIKKDDLVVAEWTDGECAPPLSGRAETHASEASSGRATQRRGHGGRRQKPSRKAVA